MSLNKQSGNMYPWVTHTWNTIKGRCPHDCMYCYMKRFKQPSLHLDNREFNVNLGKGNFIFVGSSCDMFAGGIRSEWIELTLEHCRKYSGNTYLFQSKNPRRFQSFLDSFPADSILGATIETNRNYKTSYAPSVDKRSHEMVRIDGFRKMISIEPILDFDVGIFPEMIKEIHPDFVSIGADSQGHNLHEPSAEKVKLLIWKLSQFTNVKIKFNLRRIGGGEP